MLHVDLENKIAELRSKPLLVLCRSPDGAERIQTVCDCALSGCKYIQIVADDLDALLASALEGDN